MYCAYLVLCTRPNGKQWSIFLFNLDDNSIKLLNCNFKIQKLKTELCYFFDGKTNHDLKLCEAIRSIYPT